MIRQGRVISVDPKGSSGILKDSEGTEYFFSVDECRNYQLPKVNTFVTFEKDKDYKFTDVAMLVCPLTTGPKSKAA